MNDNDNLFNNIYNPDVLTCLANLSNDEVFTPPSIVNQMLDMLPQELFSNPDTKFLDPACKTGVFLREIAKRLIKGLEKQIPDLQERVDHIFHKQLYGIAITELTSLLSRRGLYCSKYPNTEFSVTRFDTADGNIRFKKINHTWKNGKCIYCGASQDEYGRNKDLEAYAYEFIHSKSPEELIKMKFDVIISNPPYQLSTAKDEERSNAIPIYNKFVEQAFKLKSNYLCMIIPARWFSGGVGLDDFRAKMLKSNQIIELHDFPNSQDCFSGVEIKGGVCYFLMSNRKNERNPLIVTHVANDIISSARRPLLEEGLDTFIRHNDAIPIFHKVYKPNEKHFDEIVSSQTPFGIITSFKNFTDKKDSVHNVLFYTNKNIGYIDKNCITKNSDLLNGFKIYLSKSYGAGEGYPHQIINKPILGEFGSCCSQTYLNIGNFASKQEAENCMSYMKTLFFRFMVMLHKNSQDNMQKVFSLVPMQDFSKPWTDDELCQKYNLTKKEIEFIESMIKPME